jgi:ABC-type multidrug transport system fused ATPase/permease subunit
MSQLLSPSSRSVAAADLSVRHWLRRQRDRARASALGKLLGFVGPHRGYALLTVFFGVLGLLLSFAYPWIIGSVVDLASADAAARLSLSAREARLLHLTELAVAAAFLHAAVVYGRGHFNVHLGDGIVTDIRRRLFEHIQTLSLRFFAMERTGAIMSRVLYDVREATALIYMGVIVAGLDLVQLVIAVALLGQISWRLTVACMVLFPLYGIVFAAMNPRVHRASERMQTQMTEISANVAEQISGQALIKTYVAEAREARRFAEGVTRYHALVVAQSHEGHLVASSGEVLVHFGTTMVIGYGGWLALHGSMTPGTMTRFLGYMLIMFGPIRRFAELNITYQSSLSAMRRVFRVLDIQPSVVESPHPHRAPPAKGHVRFEDVRFRYADDSDEARVRLDEDGAPRASAPGGAWVLDGVTLEARPGERVALVGLSGAGKTTLLSLLPRLYDVSSGRVGIDGIDVRDYSLVALRSAISIVQQDSFLFTGSIRDNIAYGRPEASENEIVLAATAAHAHEFISRIPGGYGARVGERGVNLSGGQRQRISIARAFLKSPRVLLLDEATSSLDAESEAIVQQALEGLMGSRTCLIIAHRLSTIRNADRIYVLKGGKIVESGSHEELLARSGEYDRLVRKQTSVR